jgi:hypothetical protein
MAEQLQGLLQTARLHLPDTAEAWRFAKELEDYEIAVAEDANERYGARLRSALRTSRLPRWDWPCSPPGPRCEAARPRSIR